MADVRVTNIIYEFLITRGSRASAMNSSSRDVLPCSRGSVLGFPSSKSLPRERNSTRSQTSSTSCILWEVQRMPPDPRIANSRIFWRMSWAMAGSSDAVGSSRSNRCGSFSKALASEARVCSPEERTPHFVFRKRSSSNWFQKRFDSLPQVFHSIDHSKDSQILIHREIAR